MMKLHFFVDGISELERSLISALITDQCLGLNMPNEKIQELIQFSFSKYESNNRHYHNLGHIYSFFKFLPFVNEAIQNQKIVLFAAFFHDVIYNSLQKDNELKSAKLAEKYLKDYLPKEEMNLLYEIIISTAKHQPTIEHSDCKLFLDMDLSILAADKNTYQKYSEAIRKEYFMYPNFMYKKGRKKVLEHFLERERIFFSDIFFESFEEKARENLRKEIENLS